MASTNPYTSFTITQAFLGAPLEFQPALGSREFQELIDAYVTGSASRQDKISQVTLDFYKNATVDLNTGALVRTYHVFPAPSPWTGYSSFEQSPTQSLSSGCSPVYTPSPGSSATFGDSSYGSMSMTPPNPAQGARARVTKKAKKDTPKTTEARLPGFSIMTKDGIDVTNSAGRGTKTKEQREHAHLMRIMKACDACKKKKVRCDPSHRRSHNDMSRTASTSTQQTSSSGSASTPSLSRTTTQASSLPSFSPSNPIDDFVLFPEDDSSWNTDISFPELETQDLGQFNFDINVDLNDYLPTTDSVFDFSFDQQPQVQPQFDYTPAMNDQYGLDQWAEPQGFQPVSHSRPHPASFMNGSAELDANWQSGWLQAESLISPRTSTFTDNYWPNSVDHPQVPQSSTSNNQPLLSDTADWSLLESTLVHSTGGATNNELSQASQPRRSRKRRAESSEPLTSDIGILDPSDRQRSERVQYQAVSRTSPTNSSLEQGDSSAGCARVSGDIARLQNSAQLVSKSLRRIKRAPPEYISLGEDLQQLEGALTRLQSSQHAETILSASEIATLRSLTAQLQALSSRGVEQSRSLSANRRRNKLSQGMRPDYAQQLQVTVRRLVRSLCATINAVEAQNTGTISPTDNRPILTSGRNLQLQVSSSEPHDHERLSPVSGSDVQMSGSSSMQNSRRSATGSGIAASAAVLQRYNGNVESLDICTDVEGVCSPTRNERGSVASELLTASGMPRYSMLVKSTLSDLLPQGVEGSRPIERSELTERDILAGTDPVRLPSRLSSTFTPDEAHSRTSFSGQARSRMDFLLEEQTGGLATSQHGRTIGTTTPTSTDRALRADNVETRPSASSTLAAHNSASTKEVLPFRRNVENSYQAEISQEPSSTVLQTLPPGVVETQYSFAGALAILGSIALASSITSGLNISAHLSYLVPLLALSLLIPGQHRTSSLTTALIAGSFLLTTSLTFSGMQDVRTACTEWIGNEPFSATAKLLLIATLISSELLSSLNLSVIAVTALNYLSGARDACSSGNAVRVSRGQTSEDGYGQGSVASWLGMMDILSPVMAV